MANLNGMTVEQREQYRQAVCVAVGLDPSPELAHLDFIFMPKENGPADLVLYAKRGTAEILRDINGIDIKSLDQHDGPGYVSFKATGTNKKHRQEIAVGAHETAGLTGKRLADAVATAQTRALRRLTMQFAGHGILDESEVNTSLITAGAPASSQAALAGTSTVLPPAQVAPSQTPGLVTTITDSAGNSTPACIPMDLPAPPITGGWASVNVNGVPYIRDGKLVEQTNFSEQQQALRDEAKAYLVAQKLPKEGVSLQEIAPLKVEETDNVHCDDTPKVKKTRKKRNTVALESPGQQIEIPLGNIDSAGVITPIEPVLEVPVNGSSSLTVADIRAVRDSLLSTDVLPKQNVVMDILPEVVEAIKEEIRAEVAAPVISSEKQAEYRTRLAKYYTDILPKGGMQSSEGIGGVTMKTRKFAAVFSKVQDTKLMTEQNWEDLFKFLDSGADNPRSLVENINKALGV
jgi:hypothetical protein